VPLGVPEKYTVSFDEDDSGVITYTPPVVEEIPEE
jgi:hypothetical protein